ncbi:hypothetical protein PACTADRAFT_3531 [Pachysolen tannophilus NRRL Y-2460]|uniref:Chitobiosyldiphosphodolichol beta-mannosyltransferase n=1 Tax=Pachysolen tannophilus NRRL Y-2460 TaxID=669874 RepID=A0A1E4TSK4_PACTA|nr:hypothetical protein PACTADRAFT_3531 [Pachysolen tannophilus NRRL Y-2460]
MSWIEYKGFDHGAFEFAGWVWGLIIVYFASPLIFYIVLPAITNRFHSRLKIKKNQIVICVLGDLGHSPRMCYHAESFAKLGYQVKLCGYVESLLPLDILNDEEIDIYQIKVIKNYFHLPYILFGLLKVLYQSITLTSLLFNVMENSNYILIQNPPSLPILLIIVILKKFWFKNCKIIIDWHNLNYTILNLKFQNLQHPIVKFMKFYESFLSKYSYLNLVVSKKMGIFLNKEFGINKAKIITLYDKAANHFKPVSSQDEKLKIIAKFPQIFEVSNNFFEFEANKDKIIISSTSFSEDEDFSVLIQALMLYDEEINKSLPNLLVIITGKGPLKEKFLNQVKKADFTKIIVKTIWVSSEDYPTILSVADLGVSLHKSSSGVDLPMKIVDLFGCGIPVISLTFDSIEELVKDGVNGILVKDFIGMFNALEILLNENNGPESLEKIKKGAMLESQERWDETWNTTFGSLFRLD